MAESAPSSVMNQLEQVLANPEPMCLAVVQVEAVAPMGTEKVLCEAISARMREALRRYDELLEIDCHSVALILRTLADATVLTSRMRTFFEIAAEPYLVDGVTYEVHAYLGAAVRRPQDTPGALLGRVDMALASAREAGAIGPVVV